MATKVLSLATPPEVLQLQVGNTCRVMVNYDYSGPQVLAKIRVPIGRVGVFGFDEVVYKVVSITVPATPEKTTYQTPVDIYISSAMTVQPGYDLYAKIVDIPGADIYSPTYHNVIEITKKEYSLEISIEPPGWGYVRMDGTMVPAHETFTYPADKTVTLEAVASSGYRFDHWGGDVSGTSATIQVKMTKNIWAVAVFSEEAAPPPPPPPPPPTGYPCPKCPAVFSTEEELVAHILAAHPLPPGEYPCMFCPRTFGTSEELLAHLRLVHSWAW